MSTATCTRLLREECTSPRESPEDFVDEAVALIRKYTKPREKIEVMVSGGADSSVTAALLYLAKRDLYVTHVDTGFMRLINGREESQIVAERFKDFENFELIDERDIFYENVMGISQAELKRKLFRSAYAIVTDKQAAKHSCKVMGQGTILPDIEETPVIKTQHNIDVPFKEINKVIEPLAGLYKDEVRRVAKYLYEEEGLEVVKDVWLIQPFPGPGLSVRVPGVITPEKLNVDKQANDIVEQMIDEYTLTLYPFILNIDPETGEQIPFQSLAATFDNKFREVPSDMKKELEKYGITSCSILDTKATGMKDGKRVYAHPLCIKTGLEDYEILRRVGNKIPEKTGSSRVLYKVSEGDSSSKYVVSIRSVRSVDAVTAKVWEIPIKKVREIGNRITRECDVVSVYWDVSDKPPATIEYE